jgi:hypothetical protein
MTQAQAPHDAIFTKLEDAKWERMQPDLGEASPEIAILHIDPKTKATELLIRAPVALHVPKHWHSANETHTMIKGTAPHSVTMERRLTLDPEDSITCLPEWCMTVSSQEEKPRKSQVDSEPRRGAPKTRASEALVAIPTISSSPCAFSEAFQIFVLGGVGHLLEGRAHPLCEVCRGPLRWGR